MKRLLLALAFLLALVPAPALAAGCTFTGAFRELHDAIPTIVGDCRGNEYPTTAVSLGISPTQAASEGLDYFYDPASASWKMYNDNRAQITSKGLLVYGPNTSIRAEFTNGYQTWGFDYPADHWPNKSPNGTAVRLNTQHFPWEAAQPAPSPMPAPASSWQGSGLAHIPWIATSNWSGYMVTGGPFVEVHADWTVPATAVGLGAQAIWPGIGGSGPAALPLLQAGSAVAHPGSFLSWAWQICSVPGKMRGSRTTPLPARIFQCPSVWATRWMWTSSR